MKSIQFRPLLWPTLFSIVSFLVLISLGTWQVKRLFWKNNLISNYTEKFEKNKILYEKSFKYDSTQEFRRVLIKGKFLNNKETLIIGKTYEGNAGFHLVTPILTNENKVVLINRGWISEKLKLQKSRLFTIIEEEVTIDGIIRKPQLKGYFVPKNDIKDDFWFTIKPNEIKKARELEKYSFEENFFIDAIRNKNNRKLPIAALGKPNFRNQHLSYAITWYSLALTLLIIYFIFHIKEKRLIFKKRR